jgi:hypothetical protein
MREQRGVCRAEEEGGRRKEEVGRRKEEAYMTVEW